MVAEEEVEVWIVEGEEEMEEVAYIPLIIPVVLVLMIQEMDLELTVNHFKYVIYCIFYKWNTLI